MANDAEHFVAELASESEGTLTIAPTTPSVVTAPGASAEGGMELQSFIAAFTKPVSKLFLRDGKLFIVVEPTQGKESKVKPIRMQPQILYSSICGSTNQIPADVQVPYNPTHNEKVIVKGGSTLTTITDACGAAVKTVWAKGAFDTKSGKLRSSTDDITGSGIAISWKPKEPLDTAVVSCLLSVANVKPYFMMEVVTEDNISMLKPYGVMFYNVKAMYLHVGDNELAAA